MNVAPTVLFFPEGAFGPTNNCVGIADVLRRRGARVVFVVEESFTGTLAARGFEEALMRLNNTVTESFHNGKPMLALPLFWDQHDNAQRLDETGFGMRLPTYSFIDGEFYEAIDRLLSDAPLHGRMRDIAQRPQAHQGTETAAMLIENLAVRAP